MHIRSTCMSIKHHPASSSIKFKWSSVANQCLYQCLQQCTNQCLYQCLSSRITVNGKSGQAAHVESLSHNILSVLMLQLLHNAKPGDMDRGRNHSAVNDGKLQKRLALVGQISFVGGRFVSKEKTNVLTYMTRKKLTSKVTLGHGSVCRSKHVLNNSAKTHQTPTQVPVLIVGDKSLHGLQYNLGSAR